MRISSRLVVLAIMALAASFANAQCAGVSTSPIGSVTWTPQWCDEFNGAALSAIDSTKWTFDTGNSGFGNNELENYCDPSSNTSPCSTVNPNAYIDGSGHLDIQVRSPQANVYTSARLKTQGLQSFNAGRIEARLQFPSHSGLWPAFWMLGSQPGVNWPTVGESDIMENWPTTSSIAGPGATGNCSTIHTQVTAGNGKGKCFVFPSGQQVDTAFHVYGQIWSANMIQFYIDDPTQPYFVVTASDLPPGDTWPFSSAVNPFFLIMNMAVGGTLGNPVATDGTTGTQNPMLVDYVRQYTPSTVAPPSLTPNGSVTVTAGATTGNTAGIDMLGTVGSGRVTFSCTTTAPKASCVVTSNDAVNNHTVDFTTSATATVTVTATTTTNSSSASRSSFRLTGLASALALFLFIPIAQRRREIWFALGIVGIFLILGMPGCGGGSSGGGNGGGGGGGGTGGTTAGQYTMTINAYTVSSTDAASPDATTTVNLQVN